MAASDGIKKARAGLTEKQAKFAEAYLGEARGNGTEACRIAGYKGSDNTLATTAHDNLRKPKIVAYMDAIRDESYLLSAIGIQRTATQIAVGDARDVTVLKDGTVVEHVPKVRDRLAALKLLKDTGLFGDIDRDDIDRIVVSFRGGGQADSDGAPSDRE